MASEESQAQDCSQPLEEKIGDLQLHEKAENVVSAAHGCLDGLKDAAIITAGDGQETLDEGKEKVAAVLHDDGKDKQKTPQESVPDEVNVAKQEAANSPDDGAYVVPTVDHRSIPESEGEDKKGDVPTAVVHENADPAVKEQQQGKGIIGKISQSVKSVFSGITGSKAAKAPDVKSDETQK